MTTDLLTCLATIPDRRRAEGKMYGQAGVILFSILAMLSGARSYRQIYTLVLQPGFARCSACRGGGAVPCRAGAKPRTGLRSWRRLLGGLPCSLGARSRVDAP